MLRQLISNFTGGASRGQRRARGGYRRGGGGHRRGGAGGRRAGRRSTPAQSGIGGMIGRFMRR